MSGSVSSMTTRGYDHLVYVRLFEGCNLHCQHCFIPANPKKMEPQAFSEIPQVVSGFAKPGDKILLQWHGGEPTLLGPEYLVDAIERIQKNTDYQWVHGIQTNLLTYDDRWADVYRRYFGGEVGVSWDHGIRLLRKGKSESFADFEDAFWPKFQQLLADGLDPYLVVTMTKPLLDAYQNPVRLLEMLSSKGVKRFHLERLTPTGEARENWEWLGVSNREWSEYMSRFALAYARWMQVNAEYPEKHITCSPLDGIGLSVDRLLAGQTGGYGCLSGVCDTHFHTIDAGGYKRGCTAITAEEPDNRRAKVIRIVRIKEERQARRFDCQACEFRDICSAGCLAGDMDDGSGECAGGAILFSTLKSMRAHR